MGEVVQFPDSEAGLALKAMSIPENAVGVGGTVQPATAPPPVQHEFFKVTLTGLLRDKDLQPVSQEFHDQRPQGTVDAISLAQMWFKVRQLGGMVFDDSPTKATFYPLDSFEKITIELSPVIGVTL